MSQNDHEIPSQVAAYISKLKDQEWDVRGDAVSARSEPLEIVVRTTGPRVLSVTPSNFGTAPGVNTLTVRFNPENQLVDLDDLDTEDKIGAVFELKRSQGTGRFDLAVDATDRIRRLGN